MAYIEPLSLIVQSLWRFSADKLARSTLKYC